MASNRTKLDAQVVQVWVSYPTPSSLKSEPVSRFARFRNAIERMMTVRPQESEFMDAKYLALLSLFFKPKRSSEQRFVGIALHALNLLQVLVPKRIADEEIGDALEVIHGLRANRASRWTPVLVWLKVITTWFWVGLHAVREIGRTESKKKTD